MRLLCCSLLTMGNPIVFLRGVTLHTACLLVPVASVLFYRRSAASVVSITLLDQLDLPQTNILGQFAPYSLRQPSTALFATPWTVQPLNLGVALSSHLVSDL
jgi:hypothetical protein